MTYLLLLDLNSKTLFSTVLNSDISTQELSEDLEKDAY